MRAVSFLSPFLLVAAGTKADPLLDLHKRQVQQSYVDWGNCSKELELVKKNKTIIIQCANFTVPLDYASPSNNKTVTLQLLRVPATKGPKKGRFCSTLAVLGRLEETTSQLAVQRIWPLQVMGTGDTLTTDCMSGEELNLFNTKYPPWTNTSDVALADTWVASKVLADFCYDGMREFGQYIGTATFARDLISVVDALGEDGLLRYWGISYGTAAAMFPERVESIVLDGVVNTHEYYHGFEFEFLEKTDESWSGFFKGCVTNPLRCALAHNGTTAEQLEDDFYNYMWKLKDNPWVFGEYPVNFTTLKNTVGSAIYDPSQWNSFATSLQALYAGNATGLMHEDKLEAGGGGTPNALTAIRCSDKIPGKITRDDLFRVSAEKYKLSKLFGDSDGLQDMSCANWRMPAKEHYKGNFNVKTKKPILLIGNTWDPVTPFISAKNMSAGFEGSVALELHGYGASIPGRFLAGDKANGWLQHSSMAQPSACVIRAIRSYFNDEILPASNSTCEPDVPLFSDLGFWDILPVG